MKKVFLFFGAIALIALIGISIVSRLKTPTKTITTSMTYLTLH
jgi:hypothetical protein